MPRKDGGPESTVWGYWLVELKWLFSIVLLRFDGRSREAFHTHAFNSISWVLRGQLVEHHLDGRVEVHQAGWRPVITHRTTFHQVDSEGQSWVLSFRGPWRSTWREFVPEQNEVLTLTNGRRVLGRRHRVA